MQNNPFRSKDLATLKELLQEKLQLLEIISEIIAGKYVEFSVTVDGGREKLFHVNDVGESISDRFKLLLMVAHDYLLTEAILVQDALEYLQQ